MTFLPVFGRHTNLWLFYQFSDDILTYDFFTSFQTTKLCPQLCEHRPRWRSRQPISLLIWRLWVQPSHGARLFYQFSNDIQTYDFFTSFPTAKKTTYKPMTFFPVFGRQKKRHTNLWLFSQFSDGKKNDIQTYDFFPSFRTAKKTTYKPMTFFPVFKRHTNLWLFYQFSDDILTYDFFTSFQTTKLCPQLSRTSASLAQ